MVRSDVNQFMSFQTTARAPLSALVLIFAALGVAAGCSSDGGDEADDQDGAFKGLTEPCENFETGYPGDELCIKPPRPGEGTQVHYGPAAYDAESVRPFLIEEGDETVDVQYVDATNDEEILFDRYAGRLRPGSHHLIVSQSPTDVPDALHIDEDFPPLTFDVLFGSQTGSFDVPAKGEPLAADEKGLAFSLGARQQLSMNAHFINAGNDGPLLREAWFNVWKANPDEITTIAAPIFLVAGVSMAVAPNTTQVIKGSAVAPTNLRAHLLFGHFHSHTVRFTAWAVRNGQRDVVYEAFDYHEPPNMRYNGVVKNPMPDESTGTAGGSSGILELAEGDRFEWECEIVNNDNFTIRFANEVLTGEMCNLFGFYSPTMGGAWRQYE
jgi:hypothetical protein